MEGPSFVLMFSRLLGQHGELRAEPEKGEELETSPGFGLRGHRRGGDSDADDDGFKLEHLDLGCVGTTRAEQTS